MLGAARERVAISSGLDLVGADTEGNAQATVPSPLILVGEGVAYY
jgi:hypothetical protein